MPYLVGQAQDGNGLPTVINAQLTADVAVTPVNTFTDIVTFGTVQPGLYLVTGQVDFAQITNPAVVTLQFILGAVIQSVQESTIAVGALSVVLAPFIVSIGVAGVLKLQAASTVVTSTAKKVALNNGTGSDNLVTRATLIRLA